MVPLEWTRLIGKLGETKIEKSVLATVEGSAYDEALVRYTRAVDQIMADLNELSRRNELGRITALLCKKERG